MKGIILAGGRGTRLYPSTLVTNKHLLSIYNQPMIYYPLQIMEKVGIKEVLITTGGNNPGDFLELLRDGSQFGFHSLYYAYQDTGKSGIADALKLAEDFAKGDSVLVILGDNIFYDYLTIKKAIDSFTSGVHLFLKEVPDPQRFGVPVFDKSGDHILKIEEKPREPKSNYAITGIYIYDKKVFSIAEQFRPSSRGEYEITDVNNFYIQRDEYKWSILETEWTDAGTVDSLHHASLIAKSHSGEIK